MSDRLDMLDQSRTDWTIRVRVTRMWPSFGNNGHFIGFNYILLDAQTYHVHAFVHQPDWNAAANFIIEGNLYQITTFNVTQATGYLRPVSSQIYLILTHSTTIQPIPDDPICPIPMHKFELVQLGELYDIANSYVPYQRPIYAIDIAGIVENLDPVRIIQTDLGEKLMVRFRIQDGRNYVNVTFYDEDVEILDALIHGNFETPPIVVLANMQARVFRGSLQVSSLESSRIFVNIDYEAVNQLRKRLAEEDNGSSADDT